ncbi:hypothetical protein C4D60_Mb01t33490 [Musa balbisiana]|uniref:Uncharacterized protein n=1 Tax=Musa balbisiana TaxID=52838 RepID=A0A4S8JSL2_MUSBA|nr:hypothetical protein C4D60_Mb01t33490 [Musa balbisiana]
MEKFTNPGKKQRISRSSLYLELLSDRLRAASFRLQLTGPRLELTGFILTFLLVCLPHELQTQN